MIIGAAFKFRNMVEATPISANDIRWHALMSRRRELDIVRAFDLFREAGIEPILIKGWASARYYPASHPRAYGDIDLAVSGGDYEMARRLLDSSAEKRLGVDLHRELRHLDTVPWERLYDDSKIHTLDETAIRVLCAEDHLRVICTHWLNDGAAPKERLWDIYYAVQNRPFGFDWDRCLQVVSAERRTWVIAAIGMADRYLGLDIGDLPFASEARSLPVWLTKAAEREWASSTRLIDLELCIHDRKLLMQQVLKRIPPNPIQATIETGGPIDHRPRGRYQLADIIKRTGPSLRRIGREIFSRNNRGD